MTRRALARGLTALALLAAGPASAFGEVQITDQVQVLVLAHEVVALDGGGGRGPRAQLELGESVHWQGARGRVGVVLTNRRVLAVTPDSASWQEARYRLREAPPADALLGDRVALVVTGIRAIGFDGGAGSLVEQTLAPGERVVALDVAENVGVIVTDRRALAVSPFAGGLFEVPLQTGEQLRSLQATGELVTLRTSLRLLSFAAASGRWTTRTLNLDDR